MVLSHTPVLDSGAAGLPGSSRLLGFLDRVFIWYKLIDGRLGVSLFGLDGGVIFHVADTLSQGEIPGGGEGS